MAGEQRILLRRGTRSEWTTEDPTLSSGEASYDSTNQNLKVGDGSAAYTALQSVLPAGFVLPYAGSAAPDGFLLCDGSAVSRTAYAELFAVIGTTWGAGDGSTTFNVPDLRGAFLRGTGSHGSETMADGNPFAGPAVGAFEDDQMQAHDWYTFLDDSASQPLSSDIEDTPTRTRSGIGESDYSIGTTGSSSVANSGPTNGGIKAFGSNGTPRTGDETRPFAAGVTYCIKAY